MGSSDFSQTSLSFNLVVNPYELSYWGISPSVEFACIIILVILCLLAIWSIVHLISSVSVFRTAPISIGHLLISLCSVWVGIAPISIDHFIVMLVWVRVTPISISHLSISLCSVWVETTHIWIGHLYCQFEFSLTFWGCTCIDRPSSCQFEFFETAPISINHSSCQYEFEFSGPHLYQSIIFLSVCVQFEWGPHLYRSVIVLSVRVWGHTYIDRPSHCHVS